MSGIIKTEFEYTATSLLVPAMGYDEFCQSLQAHEYMGESINFWLGDLLVMGNREYGEDKVIQAISATRKKPDTLDSYRYVAESIEPDRRRGELSWSAHREVSRLEPAEQDAKLQTAIDYHLSSRQLRKLIKGELWIEDGQVLESADRTVPQELPDDQEARIAQARAELNPLLNRVQLYLSILGASFSEEILKMRQFGDMQQ